MGRGRWSIRNRSRFVRHVASGEDDSRIQDLVDRYLCEIRRQPVEWRFCREWRRRNLLSRPMMPAILPRVPRCALILHWSSNLRARCRVMWPDPTETRAMLEQAAGEDRSAIDRLLACHREPLRRMIAVRLDRSLGRREDASDVVQGVLLEASRRLADYLRNPAMPFQLWLRQIARDQLIDVHRRHRVAGRRSIDRERLDHRE